MSMPQYTTLVPSPVTTTATPEPHFSQAPSKWPSPQQQDAIAALSTLSDSAIFSPLTTLRTIAKGLTDEQLKGLVYLRETADDYIKAWLDSGRHLSLTGKEGQGQARD